MICVFFFFFIAFFQFNLYMRDGCQNALEIFKCNLQLLICHCSSTLAIIYLKIFFCYCLYIYLYIVYSIVLELVIIHSANRVLLRPLRSFTGAPRIWCRPIEGAQERVNKKKILDRIRKQKEKNCNSSYLSMSIVNYINEKKTFTHLNYVKFEILFFFFSSVYV